MFTKSPTSVEVCEFLDRAVERTGKKPKHVVTDGGSQFDCATFRGWCGERGVRPRYGAVGKQGSIAVIERFLLSLKAEHTRRILVLFGFDAMRREIGLYAAWYNEHRPHPGLGGMTPAEVHDGEVRPSAAFETRPRWPVPDGGSRVKRLELVVKFLEGRKHLPIVELKRAA